jgi:hypothetical protein
MRSLLSDARSDHCSATHHGSTRAVLVFMINWEK